MIEEYSWWGETNSPPDNLKTKKQLAEMGLKPLKPVGIIQTKKYDLLLYDCNNPESAGPKKQLTPKQLAAHQKARDLAWEKRLHKHWNEDYRAHLETKNEAIAHAQSILESATDWVILDTETTGLGDAEIVQIAAISLSGGVLLDTLIKPSILIPDEATEIHGITNKMIKDAPSFPDVYPHLKTVLNQKKVLIYNADFDRKILNCCCRLYSLPLLNLKERSECLMSEYAQFVGDWSDYWDDYKWQELGGNHTALGDCLKALELLRIMAETTIRTSKEAWESYREYHRDAIANASLIPTPV